MKLTLKSASAVLICSALLYTACTKSALKPTGTTAASPTATQSGQIAVNLYNALTGQYGGQSIGNGLKVPSSLAPNNNGRVVQSVNTLCGYIIDTTYTNHSTAGDTATTNSGNFKFVYTCNASTVNGYTLYDSLAFVQGAPNYQNSTILAQNYTALALVSSFQQFAVNGGLRYIVTYTSGGNTEYSNYAYVLSGLKIDNTQPKADITAGTATFVIKTLDSGPAHGTTAVSGGYTGTITYTGNYMATLVITGGKSYTVNLITGVATPI